MIRDNSRPEDKLSKKIKTCAKHYTAHTKKQKICAEHYKAYIKKMDNQNLVRNTTTHKRNNMQS